MTKLSPQLEITETQTLLVEELQSSEIHVKNGAELTLVAFLTEGWEKNAVLNFHLHDPDSKVMFLAIILGKDENKFPFETHSHHHTTNTSGFYYTRTVLFDKSRVDYRGNLVIPKPAQQTDSYLSHSTLMLSEEARTTTIPCLEIEADDVAAGHAATIGKVDDELLFYLQSRGIGKKQAQEMLVKGFLEADFHRIPEEALRTKLSKKITELV